MGLTFEPNGQIMSAKVEARECLMAHLESTKLKFLSGLKMKKKKKKNIKAYRKNSQTSGLKELWLCPVYVRLEGILI